MLTAMGGLFTYFGAGCRSSFFGIPSWYKYLQLDNKCRVTNFVVPDSLLLVALAIVDMLLYVAGIIAVGFVIYGGIRYVTSQGNPEETGKAQATVLNALIGLLLAVIAIATVSFLGSHIK